MGGTMNEAKTVSEWIDVKNNPNRNQTPRMKKALLAVTILAGIVSGAQAGLVLSEDFTYPDGGLITNSTWIANSGTANTLLVSNNTLIATTSRAEDGYHFLTGKPYMTNGPVTALFSSYTLKCIGLPTSAGTYFSHFGGSNAFTVSLATMTGHRARVNSATTNAIAGADVAASGKFCLYLLNGNDAISVTNQWPTPLDTNVTYTVVTRYVLSNAFSTIWINPTAQSDPSITDTNVLPYDIGSNGLPTNGPINISAYNFRQASGEGTMLIDNLKVGTVFADVAGLNTSPAISSISDQSIPANSNTAALPFTVSDAETPASSLTVTATSGNTTLVPNSPLNLALGGSGTNRTITVTPATGQQGSALITVNVSDSVNISSTTFTVTVGAPTISAIADVTAVSNTAIPTITFTVTDTESDPITFGKASSNPTLIPTSGISISGSGPTYNLTLTPTLNQIGVSVITITANDGFNSSQTTFRLTVRPLIGLLFDEDFLYTTYDIPNALYDASGGGSGEHWSGFPAWNHVSGPLYEIQVTNGWAYLVHTNNEDLGAGLTNAPYYGSNGVVLYTSFPVDFSLLPSPGGDYFLHLKESKADTINFRGKIFARTTGAAPGQFRLGIANQANSPVMLPLDLSTNTTNTVVMRYNAGTGESVLWVNPVNEQSSSATAQDSPGQSTIGGLALRQPGSAIGDIVIGRIKIGTSFTDVVTVVPPPTPETLHFQVVGTNMVLNWTSPQFKVSTATNLLGPWTTITGSTSPYTNGISGTAMFFRLIYP